MSTQIAQLAEANRNKMLVIVVSEVMDFLNHSMLASNGLTPNTNDHQVLASILLHNYWFAWIQQSVTVEIEINFCCI